MRKIVELLCILLLASLVTGLSCDLREGESELVTLGVPFREQPFGSDYCGAASVLMWRLRNGYPEISQDEIYAFMAGGGGWGTSPQAIRNAANHFAGVWDAYADYDGAYLPNSEQFFTRQILSVDRGVPVIPIVEYGFHAGVINGGSWGKTLDGRTVWKEVLFHDPKGYPNRRFVSNSWLDYSLAGHMTYLQIVSTVAINGWENHYFFWGPSVETFSTEPLKQY
jgi:hypothetical protein